MLNEFGHLRRHQWRSLGKMLAHPIGFIPQGEGTRDGVQSEQIQPAFQEFPSDLVGPAHRKPRPARTRWLSGPTAPARVAAL